MKVYKLARKVNQHAYCSSYVTDPRIRAIYAIGKKTLPKAEGTPLMAYSTLRQAKKYATPRSSILRCTATPYKGKRQKSRLAWIRRDISASQLTLFWKVTPPYTHEPIIQNFPPKTVLCESITPIEEIQL